jgi:hypothetical protein
VCRYPTLLSAPSRIGSSHKSGAPALTRVWCPTTHCLTSAGTCSWTQGPQQGQGHVQASTTGMPGNSGSGIHDTRLLERVSWGSITARTSACQQLGHKAMVPATSSWHIVVATLVAKWVQHPHGHSHLRTRCSMECCRQVRASSGRVVLDTGLPLDMS